MPPLPSRNPPRTRPARQGRYLELEGSRPAADAEGQRRPGQEAELHGRHPFPSKERKLVPLAAPDMPDDGVLRGFQSRPRLVLAAVSPARLLGPELQRFLPGQPGRRFEEKDPGKIFEQRQHLARRAVSPLLRRAGPELVFLPAARREDVQPDREARRQLLPGGMGHAQRPRRLRQRGLDRRRQVRPDLRPVRHLGGQARRLGRTERDQRLRPEERPRLPLCPPRPRGTDDLVKGAAAALDDGRRDQGDRDLPGHARRGLRPRRSPLRPPPNRRRPAPTRSRSS